MKTSLTIQYINLENFLLRKIPFLRFTLQLTKAYSLTAICSVRATTVCNADGHCVVA
jgi:hypothetical protein